MLPKNTVFLPLIFLFTLSPFFLAARPKLDIQFPTFKPPQPPAVTLVEENLEKVQGIIIKKYKYHSELSREELIDFYRSNLSAEGFKEIEDWSGQPAEEQLSFQFNRGRLTSVLVVILEPYSSAFKDDAGKIPYTVFVEEQSDLLHLSFYKFSRPQRLKELPAYGKAWQFLNQELPGGNTVAYLASGEVGDVIKFYQEQMPSFQWEFKNSYSRKGVINLHQASIQGTSSEKIYQDLGISEDDFFPGIDLNLEGATLVFKKGEKNCYIIINKFKDSAQALAQKRIDPEPLKKYGNIFINIVTQDESQEQSLKQDEQSKAILQHHFGQKGIKRPKFEKVNE